MSDILSTVIAPIVHMNGTSKGRLLDNLEEVYYIIDKAMDVLREAAPNGRDYYPQPGLMDKAIAQHHERGRLLLAVKESVSKEICLIEDQGK